MGDRRPPPKRELKFPQSEGGLRPLGCNGSAEVPPANRPSGTVDTSAFHAPSECGNFSSRFGPSPERHRQEIRLHFALHAYAGEGGREQRPQFHH